MDMITEAQIDKAIEYFNDDPTLVLTKIKELAQEQPYLNPFIFQDSYSVLTKDEQEYLLYIILILYQSIKGKQEYLETMSPDDLQEAEEANWAIWEDEKASGIQEKNTVLFENTEQEELLAFVEDMVLDDEDDEESELSKVGQEIAMVVGKTLIDVLTNS